VYTKPSTLDKNSSILLVIDVQENLMRIMPRREEVINSVSTLIKGAKILGVPILLTEQYPAGLGCTVKELETLIDTEKVFEKIHFDCCQEEGFRSILKDSGRLQIMVCGSETHICVLQTSISLLRSGYDVYVIADAVCSRNDIDNDTALETLRHFGAIVSTVETVLYQLMKTARGDEFKEVSQLVKRLRSLREF